jgi:hypothetical protein
MVPLNNAALTSRVARHHTKAIPYVATTPRHAQPQDLSALVEHPPFRNIGLACIVWRDATPAV